MRRTSLTKSSNLMRPRGWDRSSSSPKTTLRRVRFAPETQNQLYYYPSKRICKKKKKLCWYKPKDYQRFMKNQATLAQEFHRLDRSIDRKIIFKRRNDFLHRRDPRLPGNQPREVFVAPGTDRCLSPLALTAENATHRKGCVGQGVTSQRG